MAQGKKYSSQQCRVCGTTENLSRSKGHKTGFRSICRKHHAEYCAELRARAINESGVPVTHQVNAHAATEGQLTREQHGNIEVITSVSRTIRTIEALLDAISVDRKALSRTADTEWLVESWIANKWDQSSVIDGKVVAIELWQIKCTIRRRRAVPVAFEPVKPINVTLRIDRKSEAAPLTGLRRVLLVPDSQHGFARDHHGNLDPLHHRNAWACMVEIAKYAKPNSAIFLGDHLDLADWSDRWVHGPEFERTTQPAMVELSWNLAQVMATLVPFGKEKPCGEYLSGNHEWRMIRALQSNLRQACEIRPVDQPDGTPMYSLQRLLSLDKLNIRFHEDYPGARIWINDNLMASHGEKARGESGDTARAVLRDARCSHVYGHLHRAELVHKTVHHRFGSVTYVAFCPGTLARIDGRVPAATSRVNWQLGTALLDHEPGNGRFWITPIPIHEDGSAIYDRRVFRGKFAMSALRAGTPGWKWAA